MSALAVYPIFQLYISKKRHAGPDRTRAQTPPAESRREGVWGRHPSPALSPLSAGMLTANVHKQEHTLPRELSLPAGNSLSPHPTPSLQPSSKHLMSMLLMGALKFWRPARHLPGLSSTSPPPPWSGRCSVLRHLKNPVLPRV